MVFIILRATIFSFQILYNSFVILLFDTLNQGFLTFLVPWTPLGVNMWGRVLVNEPVL
jgi:hypothetical protein